jgi:hypothetical protein
MKTEYKEFNLVLGNGDVCKVRYCDRWGTSMFGSRTIHFEFRDCLTISHTKYRSEFRIVGDNEKVDLKEAAKKILAELTGIALKGKNI